MARTNTYTCKTCGTTYEFCLKCQVARPDFDAENFCSKEHDMIYAVLSKHGCNLITADEALKELTAFNLDDIKLTEGVLTHINKIKSEATPVKSDVITTTESIIKKTNKNSKKKW